MAVVEVEEQLCHPDLMSDPTRSATAMIKGLLMKGLARFIMSVLTLQFCSVNSKLADLRYREYKNQLLQALVCNCDFKLPCKPGTPSPEVSTIIPTKIFLTKIEIMPGQLVKAVSGRTIRCCNSLHSSTDEIVDFLSSLQYYTLRFSGTKYFA